MGGRTARPARISTTNQSIHPRPSPSGRPEISLRGSSEVVSGNVAGTAPDILVILAERISGAAAFGAAAPLPEAGSASAVSCVLPAGREWNSSAIADMIITAKAALSGDFRFAGL